MGDQVALKDTQPIHEDLARGQPGPGMVYLILKRAMDVVLSSLALIILSPIFLSIAILIKLDSPGPVLIPVKALRKGGRTFNEWKFRTMVQDADAILNNDPRLRAEFVKKFKLQNDPRVTRLGQILRRMTLNELPQFFNVLKGEMSLVGPRSIAIDETERYGPMYERMLSVPSGMTGLWIVSGRQDTPYETRVELDMYYIEHRSLWLDVKILLMTIPAVLGMTGAY